MPNQICTFTFLQLSVFVKSTFCSVSRSHRHAGLQALTESINIPPASKLGCENGHYLAGMAIRSVSDGKTQCSFWIRSARHRSNGQDRA